MTKQERHLAIKEIVGAKSIASQDDLRLELRRRGLNVTQATLSRDLTELGVSRVPSGDGTAYVLQPVAQVKSLRPLVGAEVVSIVSNETMIVIHTLPGCASLVGEYIDLLKDSDIIGTIAGDNTLLVIPASVRRTRKILKSLKEKLVGGKE